MPIVLQCIPVQHHPDDTGSINTGSICRLGTIASHLIPSSDFFYNTPVLQPLMSPTCFPLVAKKGINSCMILTLSN